MIFLLRSILFFSVLFFTTTSTLAQGDPLKRLPIGKTSTRNFDIYVEMSESQPRPTARELGVLLERFCAILDRVFHRDSLMLSDKTGTAEKKIREREPKKLFPEKQIPKRELPRCSIYIFNSRDDVRSKCHFDGIRAFGNGHVAMFSETTNSAYITRGDSTSHTRRIALHETTHYYTYNYLPGGMGCYPNWFHEGMAEALKTHEWDGIKLIVGLPPQIKGKSDPAALALIGLPRLKDYHHAHGIPKQVDGKTAIDPSLLEFFFREKFRVESLRNDGILIRGYPETIPYRYAMYRALGRFLLFEKPDQLVSALRRITLWESQNDRTFPKSQWFVEAWKAELLKNPVSIEEVEHYVKTYRSGKKSN